MFDLFKKKEEDFNIYSPCDGEMINLEDVQDELFSQKILGDGCAFNVEDGMIYSPVNGTVTAVFPTKHAIGITADNGLDILIHISLDSSSVQSNDILQYVTMDQRVKVGKALTYIDLNAFKKHNVNPITMMVITNSNKFNIVNRTEPKKVTKGEILFTTDYLR